MVGPVVPLTLHGLERSSDKERMAGFTHTQYMTNLHCLHRLSPGAVSALDAPQVQQLCATEMIMGEVESLGGSVGSRAVKQESVPHERIDVIYGLKGR